MESDGRRYARLPYFADIAYSVHGEREIKSGHCIDLSHNGLLIETDSPLDQGQIINAELSTDNPLFKPMQVTFVVVRVEKNEEGGWRISGEVTRIDGKDLKIS